MSNNDNILDLVRKMKESGYDFSNNRELYLTSLFKKHGVDPNDCWFCGCPGETTIKKEYTREVTYVNSTTTYTRTIPIVVCKECEKKCERDENLIDIAGLFAFIISFLVVILIWILLNKTDIDYFEDFFIGLFSIIGTIAIFMLVAKGVYRFTINHVVKLYRSSFKRTLRSHPLIEEAEKDGFQSKFWFMSWL